jgi:hypothetical protein
MIIRTPTLLRRYGVLTYVVRLNGLLGRFDVVRLIRARLRFVLLLGFDKGVLVFRFHIDFAFFVCRRVGSVMNFTRILTH